MRIIVKGTKNIFKYISFEWLLPPSDLEPRSANHISTVLTARPRLQTDNHADMAYILHAIHPSQFEDIMDIINLICLIDIIHV